MKLDELLLDVEEDTDDTEVEEDLYEALDLLGEARVQFEALLRKSKHWPQKTLNWQAEKELVDLEREIADFLDQWEDEE